MELPCIIQGGMGVGVSGWRLASAVASTGQLGVVSGICLDHVLARRLQMGDPDGHIRRALEHFPIKSISKRILDTFFKDKGKADNEPFKPIQMQTASMSHEREDLIVAGSFTEIFLAKEGHKGLIGINLMEKMQFDCLSTLYGSMLAGVDYVTVGAGIPREIPGILDKLSQNMITSLKLTVTNALSSDVFKSIFDPARFEQILPLKRPKFIPIVSSNALAATLAKKSTGKIDGFVIESHVAGGHNAPPRGVRNSNELTADELVYGERDEVDIEKIKDLGLPFWLGGAQGMHSKLKEAFSLGATGVQVGTPFMLSSESGYTDEIRKRIFDSQLKVVSDPKASPTGFPFKVVQLDGSLSDNKVYEERVRTCDLGYLREKYKKDDGTIGTRCPAEPIKAFVAKGGTEEMTRGSKCLCNALFANIGLPNVRKGGYVENILITGGDVLSQLDYLYYGITAKEIIEKILKD